MNTNPYLYPRYGDPERGKTLFETILSNFPRRTDLWSVYVDQLVKTGDTEAARALYRWGRGMMTDILPGIC